VTARARDEASAREREPVARHVARDPAAAAAAGLQRTIGNHATGRLLARGRKRGHAEAEAEEAEPEQSAKKAKRASLAGISKGLDEHTEKSQTTYTGNWSPEIVLTAARSFEEERDAQALRHLSTQLYWYVKTKVAGEQEVQAMLVRNRILVAANEDASIAALANALKSVSLQEVLSQAQKASDQRAERVTGKMAALYADTRPYSDVGEILRAVAANEDEQLYQTISAENAGQCKRAIAGKAGENKVFLVTAGRTLHAEQKLVLALRSSGQSGAHIYGKKRPCAFCSAMLAFANTEGMDITYNPHPGGVWKRPARGFWMLSAAADGRRVLDWLKAYSDKYKSYQTGSEDMEEDETVDFEPGSMPPGETGYDTASASEADSDSESD
jgi:deoxycytidylate deaminase